jgi:hypothetical protein
MISDEIKSISILKRCLKGDGRTVDREWSETIRAWELWAVDRRMNKTDAGFLLLRIALGLENEDGTTN